uniref:Ras-associating domain-containing protein n=2 Tax=Cacopsylla melanoneura TaxID=428564 RepID=A0A8D8XG26_9HEMI
MLKHVQLSPHRTRAADTLSLSSTASYSSLSPEPLSSRSSSYSSLSETTSSPTTTIKVFAKCLRSDIEYKTLGITFQTTCREVVTSLLNKYRMRHRDPNLFFLTMEVTVRRSGKSVRTILVLDEETRPAALQSCHPRGDSKFCLQTRRGALVKIYDSAVMPESKYKSLLISDRTTVDDLIQILLNCYSSTERVEKFSLYEVCESQEYQRKLHHDDNVLHVQSCWPSMQEFHFLIRRNPDYRSRSKSKISWTPELPSIPSSSRLSLSQPETASTSLLADYDNYFYI